MSSTNLSRLMNPKATAVIGASNREGSPGKIIFEGMMGSLRRLYPVHPTEKVILGHPAVASVDLTAGANDAMFSATLDALLDDDGVDTIICTALFAIPAVSDRLIDEIASRVCFSKKPIIVITQYGPYTDLYLRRMYNVGVVGFPSISRAVRAARLLVERQTILKREVV
jgi:acyl-CoA synthetase (NDP forming)